MLRTPCKTCPWRLDAQPGHWHQDHFKDIATTCQKDGRNTMSCHGSKPGKRIICQGWVRVMKFESIGVRIRHTFGDLTGEEVEASAVGLYPSMEAMIEAQLEFY